MGALSAERLPPFPLGTKRFLFLVGLFVNRRIFSAGRKKMSDLNPIAMREFCKNVGGFQIVGCAPNYLWVFSEKSLFKRDSIMASLFLGEDGPPRDDSPDRWVVVRMNVDATGLWSVRVSMCTGIFELYDSIAEEAEAVAWPGQAAHERKTVERFREKLEKSLKLLDYFGGEGDDRRR